MTILIWNRRTCASACATPPLRPWNESYPYRRAREVLIDNALPPRLSRILADVGHDSNHVRDYGLQDAEDVDVLAKARSERRVLVSADSDFAVLLALQEATQPSFILLREAEAVSAEQYAELLLGSFDSLEAELNRGCVAVFRRGRVRLRSLPIADA